MHDRLVHLERLVMSVMPDSAATNTDSGVQRSVPTTTGKTTGDTPIDEQSECGSMRISASELQYVGGDHWVAILGGIADLKEHIEREEQLRLADSPGRTEDSVRDSSLPSRDGAFLLYGRYRPESRDAILAALPPRYAVDRYISRYFNYLDLVSSATVHGPVFLREASLKLPMEGPSADDL
ncbi:uncharacterized protein APUU_31756S [Aspergillus puulaauensis]|uniref:Uncharacterized protein n=1 Tax=Aspergillus puulaauensis TaxID=1220207 RepID=A0A7R8ALQ3_9EURO|nr:uncharacterized protein APUU_31756S [Aspergillus puulaauensis]BCS23531.1 hypothetical protein APUU_31756S [Aspergillus puulaauensis]